MKDITTRSRAPQPSANHRPYLLMGVLTIVLAFGVLGAWAATARLDSAVIAVGNVTVESNRKTIQHLEGGIVSEILVSDGEIVEEGQVLMRLQPLQASASVETYASQLDAALAYEARLLAERDGADVVTFPASLKSRLDNPNTKKLLADQVRQFEERRASLKAQEDILSARVDQLQQEIAGVAALRDSTKEQMENLQQELANVSDLAERGFYPKNRLNALKRNLAQLQGQYGQTIADISKNENAIAETKLQMIQARVKFQEEVSQQLREVRVQVSEFTERLRVASDVLQRNEIRAPLKGKIQSLRFHTIGGVVRQGEPIMDIVPVNDAFKIRARVSPLDVNYVLKGVEAEVRFPGFKSRNAPLILGFVRDISADSLTDEATGESYFLSEIEVKNSSLPPELVGKLTAGMPAEVMIATGERTVIDYLVGPLLDAIRHTMREH